MSSSDCAPLRAPQKGGQLAAQVVRPHLLSFANASISRTVGVLKMTLDPPTLVDAKQAFATRLKTNRSAWTLFSLMGIAVFFLELWAFAPLIRDYVPGDDDVALSVVSTDVAGPPDVRSWFLDGYHNYFSAYPEWSAPVTNFMRPIANAIYWACFQLFGTHFAYQLILGYFGHAMTVTLCGWIAFSIFRLPPALAFGSALVATLSPSFWTLDKTPYSIPDLIQFPICQTEIFDALLMLAAFIAFVKHRFVLFAIATTLALFLKETALSVPIAALLLPSVWLTQSRLRSAVNGALIVTPFILWLAARVFIFDHETPRYIFGAGSHISQLALIARNMLLWPTGLFTNSLQQLKHAFTNRDWFTLLNAAMDVGFNALWSLALIASMSWAIRQFGKSWLRVEPAPWVMGLTFALGTLGLVMLIRTQSLRYGYFWFALGPPAILAALSMHRVRVAALPLILCLIAPEASNALQTLSKDNREAYAIVKESGTQLVGLLGELPASVRHVYLIDEMISQNSSPEYLARFSGFKGVITYVNTVLPVPHCDVARAPQNRYVLQLNAATQQLTYITSACLDKPWEAFTSDRIGPGNVVLRGDDMRYTFPGLSFHRQSLLANDENYDLGAHWQVQVTNPVCATEGACVWIGLDAVRRRYFVLNDSVLAENASVE